ncbi:MAG: cytochrome c family protein [Proteobacteria bacterium]|nr:cytochrome c family protein [Pseudomonadota bacterium]
MNKKSAHKKYSLRNLLGSACAVAMLLALPVQLLAGEATPPGQIPEKITINVQTSCPQIADLDQDKKEVKEFSHKLHAEKYLLGKSAFAAHPYTDAFTCAACHTGAESPEAITGADKCERLTAAIEKEGGPKKYKEMMHAVCQNCHKNMQKAGESKSGPAKCNECHSK